MKKRLVASLAAAMVLGVAGSAFAAANPFVDVPANNWAYTSVKMLAKAGIVDGYSDGTFKGDKTITRYEMAQIVAKAMVNEAKANAEQKAEIEKLKAEYTDELTKLGVRMDTLESKMGNIKFGADARIRYRENFGLAGTSAGGASVGSFQERVRFTATAAIDDNWTFNGRFGEQNTNFRGGSWATTGQDGSNTGAFMFDKMEFAWKNQNLFGTIGRSYYFLGQGAIMDAGCFDGAAFGAATGKLTTRVSYGDMSQMAKYYGSYIPAAVGTNTTNANTNGYPNQKAVIAEMKYAVSPTLNFTADYLKSENLATYAYKQSAFGVNDTFMNGGVNFQGEYVHNAAAANGVQPNAWYGQVTVNPVNVAKPGSFDYGLNYYSLGANSIDANLTTLNIMNNTTGFKGYGVFTDYVFAKNAKLNIWYQHGTPYDKNSAGFSNYSNAYGGVATFAF